MVVVRLYFRSYLESSRRRDERQTGLMQPEDTYADSLTHMDTHKFIP